MKKTILALAALAAGGVVAHDGARSPHITAFNRAPLLTHITRETGGANRTVYDLQGEWDYKRIGTAIFTNSVPPYQKTASKWIVGDRAVDVNAITNWGHAHVPGVAGGQEQLTHFYRKRFVTPKGWKTGDSIVMSHERTGELIDIYMNGRKIVAARDMVNLLRRFDVSENAHEGTNELVVALRTVGSRTVWNDKVEWYLTEVTTGMTGPVHLEFTGGCYVKRGHIMTAVTPEKTITYEAVIVNNGKTDRTLVLGCDVKDGVDFGQQTFVAKAGAETVVRRTVAWPDAHLWNPDDPFLYFARFRLFAKALLGVGNELDAVQTRFGFREVKAEGHRVLLNGFPVIMRRKTEHPGEQFATKAEILAGFEALRRDGIVALRVRWTEQERIADAADEFGMMLEPCMYAGFAASSKKDGFWKHYAEYAREFVEQLRDHPSIVDWAISNEFGTFYSSCEGRPEEQPTSAKQAKIGQLVASIDPTRLWTVCGENELAYPVRSAKDGPVPTRSVHYPFQVVSDGHELPNAGYWYANGEVPWQGNAKKNKPLFISEDIYHGAQDNFRGLSKYAGDHHYQLTKGEHNYSETMGWIIRSYAEGYYYSGLGQWDAWCLFPGSIPRCTFYDRGQLMPDYLFTFLEFPKNLFVGETVERTLSFYNERFTALDGEVWRRVNDGPDEFVAAVRSEPGSRWSAIERLRPPKPGEFKVRYVFRANGRDYGARTFTFNAFARRNPKQDIFRGVAVYAGPKSLEKCTEIVITNALTEADGRAIEKWVRAGGKALAFDFSPESWTPVPVEYGRRSTFVWRRAPRVMQNYEEDFAASWAPDGYVSLSGIPKPEEDSDVLWDIGRKDGLTSAAVVRIYRGKGSWLLCQLPVLARLDVEPSAALFLSLVMDTFRGKCTRPAGTVALDVGTNTNSVLPELLANLGTKPVAKWIDAACLLVDATAGLEPAQREALADAYAAGKKVIVVGLGKDEPIFADYGFETAMPTPSDRATHPWLPGRLGDKADTGVKWVTHTDSPGLLSGVSNDDLFWWDLDKMTSWTQQIVLRSVPRGNVDMYACSALIRPKKGTQAICATSPCAWVQVADKKTGGTLALSTLRIAKAAKNARPQALRMLRRVLMNAGVTTAPDRPLYESHPIDISKAANRNFWQDPLFKKADGTFEPDGWFGGGNDLRYFPVNLCGWSLSSGAFCPKEKMPEKPLKLAGVPFQMTDPLKNGGRGLIVVGEGETVTVKLDKPVAADRLRFLGAFEKWERPPASHFKVEIRVNADQSSALQVQQCVHLGWYRMPNVVSKGKAAWVGRTPKDPTATLYCWGMDTPKDGALVREITIKNTGNAGGIGIVAITAEKDVEL